MSCQEAKVGDDKGQGHTQDGTKTQNTRIYILTYILIFSRMLEFVCVEKGPCPMSFKWPG